VRRILVTGASGFVGGHLRAALRAAFPAATLVAATRGESVAGWDEAVRLDLLDVASCATAVRAARPEAVIHLAAMAETGASFRDPQRSWRTNLLGTLAMAEAVMAEAPDALFVQASSAEVYGLSFQESRPLAEDALLSQEEIPVSVDIIDKLPSPFGLVRYGVAPDHLNTLAGHVGRDIQLGQHFRCAENDRQRGA
jgi:nucleoside-diphosphate-sugar epimerase